MGINELYAVSLIAGPVPPSNLTLTSSNGAYSLSWDAGVLQSASTLGGPYLDVQTSEKRG